MDIIERIDQFVAMWRKVTHLAETSELLDIMLEAKHEIEMLRNEHVTNLGKGWQD